jgi:hypothetical protein
MPVSRNTDRKNNSGVALKGIIVGGRLKIDADSEIGPRTYNSRRAD